MGVDAPALRYGAAAITSVKHLPLCLPGDQAGRWSAGSRKSGLLCIKSVRVALFRLRYTTHLGHVLLSEEARASFARFAGVTGSCSLWGALAGCPVYLVSGLPDRIPSLDPPRHHGT